MEAELRCPGRTSSAGIEPEPIAAGTIAQVHRATLVDGERGREGAAAERRDADQAGPRAARAVAAKAGNRPSFQQVVDVPAIIEQLSSRCCASWTSGRGRQHRADASGLAPFDRLDVPRVHTELSTATAAGHGGDPGDPGAAGARATPAGRRPASCSRPTTTGSRGRLLPRRPAPGNMMWWNDRIYLLDLGMVGEVDAGLRESLLLLLLAFGQEDAAFLADAMLGLASERAGADFDEAAFRADLSTLLASHRHVSLSELRLGPLLQQLTEILGTAPGAAPVHADADRQGVRPDAAGRGRAGPLAGPVRGGGGKFLPAATAGPDGGPWPTRSSFATAARRFGCARPGCSKGSNGRSGCAAVVPASRSTCAASRI